MPHPIAGFGGGYKIVMPGVCSYGSVASHHFTWMRHRKSRVNLLDGNSFYEEILDAGRLSRMAFKLDFIINERKEVFKAFSGDPETEHREASQFSASLYTVPLSKLADVTITSAFPLEVGVQATKALTMAGFCTRSGGAILWVAPQKEAGPILPLIKEMGSPETAGAQSWCVQKGALGHYRKGRPSPKRMNSILLLRVDFLILCGKIPRRTWRVPLFFARFREDAIHRPMD